jgi:hypothetical protein
MAGTGVAVGRADGRATALSVILPLKRGGRFWLRPWLALLRSNRWLRGKAYRDLDDLQFIYAIRWSLLAPHERRRWPVFLSPDQRWHLLFESNFDGDWDEYLENFAAVLGWGLSTLVWVGAGYTGLTNPSMFKRYAKLHDHLPEHYVSGYPELSANDIRQEVVARYGPGILQAFRQRAYLGEGPTWSTFLLPIRHGQEGEAVRAARAMDCGSGAGQGREVFRSTGLVHFARVVVDQQERRSWVLITITHDDDVAPILHAALAADTRMGQARAAEAAAVVAADSGSSPGPRRPSRDAPAPHPSGAGPLHVLVACTGGVPPIEGSWWDDQRYVDHLLRNQPSSTSSSLAYCGYPGFRVADIEAMAADPRRHDAFPETEAT